MVSRLAYPEIAARVLDDQHNPTRSQSLLNTKADLLEINQDATSLCRKELGHRTLTAHINERDSDSKRGPLALRVIFLDTAPTGEAMLHPTTTHWLRQNFDVSSLFIEYISNGRATWLKAGNVYFCRRDGEGKVFAIDGFYRYSCGFGSGPAHVWFLHDFAKRTSTYILHNCSELTKQLIIRSAGDAPSSLLRFGVIDVFIQEDSAQAWGKNMGTARAALIKIEQSSRNLGLSPSFTAKAVEELHNLSTEFHIISEDMTDLEERLELLINVHKQRMDTSYGFQEANPTDDSIRFLISRTHVWKRWVSNYTRRTQIRINLFFNLASQADNRINLDIAKFTSQIAVDTQRDSSSMITIAAVTMFFLPGTFVSALFSMVFFNTGTDGSGETTFTVAPQWWYFPAITVPLTIIVFAVWTLWKQWRIGKHTGLPAGVEVSNAALYNGATEKLDGYKTMLT